MSDLGELHGGRAIAATPADLLLRLRQHRTFGSAPTAELEWLAARAILRRFAEGDVMTVKGKPIVYMWVVLSGHMGFYTERGSGRGKIMEWVGGEVAGVLPYSRLLTSPGFAIAEVETDVLGVHRDHFPEMITAAPTLTTACVHAMLDRARHFTKEFVQDEKLVALGKLAAGLAHELNNPASAAARSTKLLAEAITHACDAARALGAAGVTDAQLATICDVQKQAIGTTTRLWSALDLSDREDAFEEWLEAHGLEAEITAVLADTALTVTDLEELADVLDASLLPVAVRWIAAEHTARDLAREVERATSRIHELVSAVKRFTYMGREASAEPTDVIPGIEDTVAVLSSKFRARGASLQTELPSDLPPVRAFGGELNQVWHNLIDNALDALDPASKDGVVWVRACTRRDEVMIEVSDNGRGIDEEIRDRIFDPFFTTKDVKDGTGLGLDIARRIVVRHNGTIELDSRPGETVFRVLLPIAATTKAGHETDAITSA